MKKRCLSIGLTVLSILMLTLPTVQTRGNVSAATPPPKTLAGTIPFAVKSGQARLIGHHLGTDHLALAIALPLRNKQALTQLLQEVSTPRNLQFRHYLTQAQANQAFNPTPQQEQQVINWLKSHGLTVTNTHTNHLLVDVTGTFAQIEQVFHVTINDYTMQFKGKRTTFYAPATEPTVDVSVKNIIESIVGLDDYPRFHFDDTLASALPADNGNAHGSPPYYPQDFANAYDVNPLWNLGDNGKGKGQHIGIILPGTPPTDATLNIFQTQTNADVATQGNGRLKVIPVDGGSKLLGGSEAGMDIEYASGMAPKAIIDYYEMPGVNQNSPTPQEIDDALNMAGSDANNNQQISNSWDDGGAWINNCEPSQIDSYINTTEEILAANSITGHNYFFASGDNGSACVFNGNSKCSKVQDPYPAYPASSAYVTSVGGTNLSIQNNSWQNEVAWNYSGSTCSDKSSRTPPGGSGGGYSNLFSEPTWQSGIPDPNNRRGFPDIAADADPSTGAYICYNGKKNSSTCTIIGNPLTYEGGTSLATPLWAGMIADVNQYVQSQNKLPLGFINPLLYAMHTGMPYDAYHDIPKCPKDTNGNCTNGKYYTDTGWDAVTGLGSPDLYNLARDAASLDASNGGKLDWRYQTEGAVYSSPTVVNGVVYVGSYDGYVYAFNASNGTLLWRYQTEVSNQLGNAVYSSPTVVNGVVYVGSYDGYVYALNASSGALLWRYQTGWQVFSSPTVANGVVYVGSNDDYIYALDASTGTLLWRYQTDNWVTSSPVVANGVVYVGSADHYVYALDASNGTLLWSYQTGNWVYSSPTVANGVVYVASYDDYIYALNASTGTLLWSYQTGLYIESSPRVVNGVVYIGSNDGYVYALDASTGTLLWRYQTTGGVISSPAVVNGVVYIGSSDDYVYALNVSNGALLWRYQTGNAVESSPAVDNGVVYVGSDDDYVYALAA